MSSSADSRTYASYTRFELELEFVQVLSNPYYLNHLATQNLLNDHTFVNYLEYLHTYWRKPEYTKYLSYPGPTLRTLELLQQEEFRKAIVAPGVVMSLVEGGMAARPR